jgi:hypothetical protein
MNPVLALRSRAIMIEQFGEQLTTCVEDLNELCRKFFQFINDQVFENEQEWQHALSVFRKSVYDAAGGILITSLSTAAAGFLLCRIGASFLHPNEKILFCTHDASRFA